MAFVALTAVTLAGTIAVAGNEYRKKIQRRKYREVARQLTEPREILSCLVDQVYAVSEGSYKFASEIWTILGYERVPIAKRYDYEESSRRRRVQLMVFRRRDATMVSSRLPWQYVIAIRGTKLSSKTDILNDIRICFGNLHTSSRYKKILKLIKDLIHKHGEENVCVTGHSLGAAFGLLATRELVLKAGKFVETHLFNPPFFSHQILLEKGWEAVNVLVAKMSQTIWESDAATSSKGEISEVFAKVMKLDNAEFGRVIMEEFNKLQSWRPHLYVNPGDWICSGYCMHFDKPPLPKDHPHILKSATTIPAMMGQAFAEQAGKARQPGPLLAKTVSKWGPKSFFLIPRAKLVINYYSPKKGTYRECHKLNQWYYSRKIHALLEKECNLLLEPRSDAATISEGSQPSPLQRSRTEGHQPSPLQETRTERSQPSSWTRGTLRTQPAPSGDATLEISDQRNESRNSYSEYDPNLEYDSDGSKSEQDEGSLDARFRVFDSDPDFSD